VLRRGRIFWPAGKFDGMPALDVLIHRANATDLETMMIAGRPVLDAGRITTVDEDRLETAIEEAVEKRMYVASKQVTRWRELGVEVDRTCLSSAGGGPRSPSSRPTSITSNIRPAWLSQAQRK
jgi:hypothetical protein